MPITATWSRITFTFALVRKRGLTNEKITTSRMSAKKSPFRFDHSRTARLAAP